MQQFMWVLASISIMAAVTVMTVYCLRTLQPLPVRWQKYALVPRSEPVRPVSRGETAAWFAGGIAWLWLMVMVAYLIAHGSLEGFMGYFSYRFIRQGDASNYLYLAEHGYSSVGDERCYIVFYPLFPMLVRLVSVLTAGSYEVAGVLASHLCYGASAAVMRHLAAEVLPEKQARCATAAMLLYPFSFFCFGPYTESLFMLLAVGCLLALRKEKWWVAGTLAMLAALCRTQGVALCFACAYGYLSAAPERRGGWVNLLPSLGALVGFGGYLTLNWVVTGSFFTFMSYQQSTWFHEVRWFGDNLASQLGSALTMEDMRVGTFIPEIVLYFLGCWGLSWLFHREKRSPEGVYSLAFLGMSYISSWLISGSRYMYGCVGLYLLPGQLKRRWTRCLVLAAEAALAVYYTYLYVSNAKIW